PTRCRHGGSRRRGGRPHWRRRRRPAADRSAARPGAICSWREGTSAATCPTDSKTPSGRGERRRGRGLSKANKKPILSSCCHLSRQRGGGQSGKELLKSIVHCNISGILYTQIWFGGARESHHLED